MEAAAHRAQRLAIARILRERPVILGDAVQYLRRLEQVDFEQLAIEVARVGGEQTLRLLGNFRDGRRRIADRLDRRRQPRGIAGLELGQHRAGLLDQLGVADEFRVVAQARELLLQAVACRRVGGRAMHFVNELRQRRAQFRDGGLDRVALGMRWRRRLAQSLGDQRRDQPVAIGTLLLDRLDVEAETGQRFRQQFEIVVADRRFRIGIRGDLLLAQLEQAVGFVQAQDAQRAADLRAVLGQRGEIGALRVVAEKAVQHLFDVAQIGLDLAADLRQQHALLRALAHLVEHRRRRRREAALARRVQPAQHRVDLARELRRQIRIVLERALGEQQRGRVFHRHRFGNARRRHLVQALDERRRQLHQRAVVNLGGLGMHGGQRLLQLRQVLRASRRRLEPRVLGARQLLARFAQQRLQAYDVGRQHLGRRDESGKLERALHRLHLRTDRRADRDEIEHFATQAVGDLGAAFGHAADLQIDARGKLLDAEAAVETTFDQALEHRADGPPECAQAALRRDVLDAGDRVAHGGGATFVAAQPREQSALVQPALLDEERWQPVGRDRFARRDARRPRRQVGIEEIGGRDGLDAARALHRLVFRIELERHRLHAVDELVQEDFELATRAIDDVAARRCFPRRQVLEAHELALEFVGEGDDGVQPDHLDGAGRLVHVRAGVLERRCVLGTGAEQGEGLEPARQCLVDFALHP